MDQEFYTSVTEIQLAKVKQQILAWANQHAYCAVYLSNALQPSCGYKTVELLAGVGCAQKLEFQKGEVFHQLKKQQKAEWLFGYLGYDLKNEIENLTSENKEYIPTQDSVFFVPEVVIEITPNGQVRVIGANPEQVWTSINAVELVEESSFKMKEPVKAAMTKEEYTHKVHQILNHIKAGDVYELNLCQEFYGEVKEGNPLATFLKLNQTSPMPFAAYLKLDQVYVLGASPERFLGKVGNRLISQPIKGTTRRGTNAAEDKQKISQLLASEKERAENLMIVDLVRNDLSRSCLPGTVRVEELFGIYSFQRVHQMISTVSGEVEPAMHWTDTITNAFPMGSMTGAPKVMAMKLIEAYELSKRGIYSGAIGYVAPSGDFDFNVVIRSLIYRADSKKISFQVGGAITWDSAPEAEYEECMLKAQAIRHVLEG